MNTVMNIGTNGIRRFFQLGGRVLSGICMAATIACAAEQTVVPSSKEVTAETSSNPAETIAQKWGIQVSGLFLSAGGNMVDFRYKVLAPAKAGLLTKPEIKPTLVNQATGAKLIVPDTPKVGQLRQTVKQPVAGKIYFMLFANTRHHVKSGDKVTITAGDFKLEDLVVE